MHLADAFIQSDLHYIQVTVSTFYQLLGYITFKSISESGGSNSVTAEMTIKHCYKESSYIYIFLQRHTHVYILSSVQTHTPELSVSQTLRTSCSSSECLIFKSFDVCVCVCVHKLEKEAYCGNTGFMISINSSCFYTFKFLKTDSLLKEKTEQMLYMSLIS